MLLTSPEARGHSESAVPWAEFSPLGLYPMKVCYNTEMIGYRKCLCQNEVKCLFKKKKLSIAVGSFDIQLGEGVNTKKDSLD